jgi:tripeptide aminopeptidase
MTFRAPLNPDRLLQRFLRYVQIDTTAGEVGEHYPSSPGQLDLCRVLLAELQQLGLTDATMNEQGIVMATVPATVKHAAPVVAFNSHVDTSPETTGKNVRPQLWKNYQGTDLTLPGKPELVIRVSENPDLLKCVGHTVITTDGTTLLGSDDKSGIAVIMELAQILVENPSIAHGPVRVLFTCDEEVGHGVDYVDLKALAADVCYTLDGGGCDEIDAETFSADLAIVTITGVNIHPSIAKGRMVNAVRAASDFVDRLPRSTLSPETTDQRQGFLHPYSITGGVAEVTIKLILRDFDTPKLTDWANILRESATATEREFPGVAIKVETSAQYRNLGDGLKREPRALILAEQALKNLGRTPKLSIIRGGTDGSRLTELGLPTPNLSTGEHNPHSPLEWTSLEEMCLAVDGLVELVKLWGQERKTS